MGRDWLGFGGWVVGREGFDERAQKGVGVVDVAARLGEW